MNITIVSVIFCYLFGGFIVFLRFILVCGKNSMAYSDFVYSSEVQQSLHNNDSSTNFRFYQFSQKRFIIINTTFHVPPLEICIYPFVSRYGIFIHY